MGTPFYVVPEVLRKGYGVEVDIWSLGVIMFVMLSGEAPFEGADEKETFNNILKVKYSFEDPIWINISRDAKDLISKIFVRNPR